MATKVRVAEEELTEEAPAAEAERLTIGEWALAWVGGVGLVVVMAIMVYLVANANIIGG